VRLVQPKVKVTDHKRHLAVEQLRQTPNQMLGRKLKVLFVEYNLFAY
jgi:hypothetical protein